MVKQEIIDKWKALGVEPGAHLRSGHEVFVCHGIIGAGGMGCVVLLRDLSLGGPLQAAKLLPPELAKDPAMIRSFEHEARLGKLLAETPRDEKGLKSDQSKYIVAVSRLSQFDNGIRFFLMEHVEGESLHALLSRYRARKTPLAPQVCVPLGIDMLEGASYAHSRDVFHRDIKPGNILLTKGADGQPLAKLCDFGIHRIFGDPHGGFAGTHSYCAYEQLTGDVVDAKADVFACAAVIFECLTLHVPWAVKGDDASVFQRAAEARLRIPSLGSFGDFPSELIEIIDLALSPDPSTRPDAKRFAEILAEIHRKYYDDDRDPYGAITEEKPASGPQAPPDKITRDHLNPTQPTRLDTDQRTNGDGLPITAKAANAGAPPANDVHPEAPKPNASPENFSGGSGNEEPRAPRIIRAKQVNDVPHDLPKPKLSYETEPNGPPLNMSERSIVPLVPVPHTKPPPSPPPTKPPASAEASLPPVSLGGPNSTEYVDPALRVDAAPIMIVQSNTLPTNQLQGGAHYPSFEAELRTRFYGSAAPAVPKPAEPANDEEQASGERPKTAQPFAGPQWKPKPKNGSQPFPIELPSQEAIDVRERGPLPNISLAPRGPEPRRPSTNAIGELLEEAERLKAREAAGGKQIRTVPYPPRKKAAPDNETAVAPPMWRERLRWRIEAFVRWSTRFEGIATIALLLFIAMVVGTLIYLLRRGIL